MASNQLIYPADIAAYKDCKCPAPDEQDWCPAEFPPPYPPRPVYPCPVPPPPFPWPIPPCPPPPPEPKKTSTEGKICKLSKKAAIVNKMIEGLETKKKDFIMKVGDATYNFGNTDLEVDNWDDGSYADTALKVLKFELALIKNKIAELSAEIGEEADNLGGTESTVAGDDNG